MNRDDITGRSPPWLHVLRGPMSDARTPSSSVWPISDQYSQSCIVRYVRGSSMQSKRMLLAEYRSAFRFPCYFGQNWDAFRDCIFDLSWLIRDWRIGQPGKFPAAIVSIVIDAPLVLADENPDEHKTWLAILHESGEDWLNSECANLSRPPIVFRTLLQATEVSNAFLDSLRRSSTPFDSFEV